MEPLQPLEPRLFTVALRHVVHVHFVPLQDGQIRVTAQVTNAADVMDHETFQWLCLSVEEALDVVAAVVAAQVS